MHAVVLGVWSVIWWIMGKSSGAAHGVMVSTMDSESSDPGPNIGRISFCVRLQRVVSVLCMRLFLACGR